MRLDYVLGFVRSAQNSIFCLWKYEW